MQNQPPCNISLICQLCQTLRGLTGQLWEVGLRANRERGRKSILTRIVLHSFAIDPYSAQSLAILKAIRLGSQLHTNIRQREAMSNNQRQAAITEVKFLLHEHAKILSFKKNCLASF